MGEGEWFSLGWRIQPPRNLQKTALAFPSPVGRERVRVTEVFFALRLPSVTCFCTNVSHAEARQSLQSLLSRHAKRGARPARCLARVGTRLLSHHHWHQWFGKIHAAQCRGGNVSRGHGPNQSGWARHHALERTQARPAHRSSVSESFQR